MANAGCTVCRQVHNLAVNQVIVQLNFSLGLLYRLEAFINGPDLGSETLTGLPKTPDGKFQADEDGLIPGF
jgi:hypothetical protein